jgi:hypothetical protein
LRLHSKEEKGETWNILSHFFTQNGVAVVVAEDFGDLIVTEMKSRGITRPCRIPPFSYGRKRWVDSEKGKAYNTILIVIVP